MARLTIGRSSVHTKTSQNEALPAIMLAASSAFPTDVLVGVTTTG